MFGWKTIPIHGERHPTKFVALYSDSTLVVLCWAIVGLAKTQPLQKRNFNSSSILSEIHLSFQIVSDFFVWKLEQWFTFAHFILPKKIEMAIDKPGSGFHAVANSIEIHGLTMEYNNNKTKMKWMMQSLPTPEHFHGPNPFHNTGGSLAPTAQKLPHSCQSFYKLPLLEKQCSLMDSTLEGGYMESELDSALTGQGSHYPVCGVPNPQLA